MKVTKTVFFTTILFSSIFTSAQSIQNFQEQIQSNHMSALDEISDKPATEPKLNSEKSKTNLQLEAKKNEEILTKKSNIYSLKTRSEKTPFATVSTTEGDFTIQLFPEYAPNTVKNFIDLATGQKEFTDALTSKKSTRPFYNDTIIFKVIKGFTIQLGCPFGNGTGDPGYKIPDEINPYLHHNKRGIVGMSNYGPNTAGSQFFINLAPHSEFDKKYTAFGFVTEGFDVLKKIENTDVGPTNRPLKRIVVKNISISYKN